MSCDMDSSTGHAISQALLTLQNSGNNVFISGEETTPQTLPTGEAMDVGLGMAPPLNNSEGSAEAMQSSGSTVNTQQPPSVPGVNNRKRYDEGKDGYLCIGELKRMMEKLGAPQTHLGLKAMIKEVDEDGDDKISFREFLLIYRKARAGELTEDSGLSQLAALTEINVEEVGVEGAKNFFEAKIEELRKTSKFEDEIRQEQEQRKREEEEKAQRRAMFKQRAAIFQSGSMQQT